MGDMQEFRADSGDGGNRTRATFPPCQQWLYRLYDADGALLYIGITERGYDRFAAHRTKQAWWSEVAQHTIQAYATRADVEIAERHAIYREKPRYNIAHNSTGRRLYGTEPIPASEPLTREAYTAEALGRLLNAWDEPKAEVIELDRFRERRRHRRPNLLTGPHGHGARAGQLPRPALGDPATGLLLPHETPARPASRTEER